MWPALLKWPLAVWAALNAVDDLGDSWRLLKLVATGLTGGVGSSDDNLCSLCDGVMSDMLLKGSEGISELPCNWVCLRIPKCVRMCERLKDFSTNSTSFPCVAAGYCPGKSHTQVSHKSHTSLTQVSHKSRTSLTQVSDRVYCLQRCKSHIHTRLFPWATTPQLFAFVPPGVLFAERQVSHTTVPTCPRMSRPPFFPYVTGFRLCPAEDGAGGTELSSVTVSFFFSVTVSLSLTAPMVSRPFVAHHVFPHVTHHVFSRSSRVILL